MASGLLSWLVPALLLGATVAPGHASPITGAMLGSGTAEGSWDVDASGNATIARRAMPGAATDDVVRKFEQLERTRPVVKEIFLIPDDPNKKEFQRSLHPRDEFTMEWRINDVSGTTPTLSSDPVNMLDRLTVSQKPLSGGQKVEKWQKARKATPGLFPRGPNVRFQVQQQRSLPARVGSRTPSIDGAEYDFTLNLVDGIIIVNTARGPIPADGGNRIAINRFPDLTSWSEVVFEVWCRIKPKRRSTSATGASLIRPVPGFDAVNPFKTFGPQITETEFEKKLGGFLNYIFMVDIKEPAEEVSIIKRCLASRTDADRYPGYDDAQRFSVGHWCFYALLASEHGEAVAWLLATHKGPGTVKIARLGNKILKSVTIFTTTPDGGQQQQHPTLMWELVEHDAEMVKLRDDMQNQWLTSGTADAKRYNYPSVSEIESAGRAPFGAQSAGYQAKPGGSTSISGQSLQVPGQGSSGAKGKGKESASQGQSPSGSDDFSWAINYPSSSDSRGGSPMDVPKPGDGAPQPAGGSGAGASSSG